jgi:hypothetical protein
VSEQIMLEPTEEALVLASRRWAELRQRDTLLVERLRQLSVEKEALRAERELLQVEVVAARMAMTEAAQSLVGPWDGGVAE